MEGFLEGYNFFVKSIGNVISSQESAKYIDAVNAEIDKLKLNLNSFEGYATNAGQLKGKIAEFWHAGTFNIKAAIRDSANRAEALESNGLGSVDVKLNTGENYGLKYDANASYTLKDQSKSFYERYKVYASRITRAGKQAPTFDEYIRNNAQSLKESGIDPKNINLNDPLYQGQYRLVPADQYSEIKKLLEQKIAKEQITRPEQAERYRDALKMLKMRIEDNKGNKKEAEELAKLAKEGNVDPRKLGLDISDLIKPEDILRQSFKAGMTAATITMVLKVAPEILKTIDYLLKNGYVDTEQFKKVGFAAVQGASRGFLSGSISSAITTVCKAGLCGKALESVNPSVVGTVTVIIINTIENAFKVVMCNMTQREMANQFVKDLSLSAFSLICGGIAQALMQIPVWGFMIGSFLGSVMGAFAYNGVYSAVLSLCVNTGFTMFGLVEQNYKIPNEILDELGITKFEYDEFKLDKFERDKFEYDKFNYDEFQYDDIGIRFLKRGVIGVSKVGYVL